MTTPLAADSTEITVATLWWSDILGKNTPSTVGDDKLDEMLAFTRAISRSERPTPEQVEVFETTLMEQLAQQFASYAESGSRGSITLSVDYHPEDLLLTALAAAGITEQDAKFPLKTVMWIDQGRVEVKQGYGAEPKRLL